MAGIKVRISRKKKDSRFGYHSHRPGVVWPAIPDRRSAQLLALLHQLEQSQWWSPQKLRKAQLAQSLELLHHARKTVPYYKERLGFLEGTQELDESLWTKIPILTRQDLQQSQNDLTSDLIHPSHGKIKEIRTSGSTGMPVTIKQTDSFHLFFDAFNLREHFWLGQDCMYKQMVIRNINGLKSGMVKVQESWGPPFNRIFNTGQSVMIDVSTDIQPQIENLVQHQPEYLVTYPSNLKELLRQNEIAQVRNIKQVRTLSESIPDGLRKEVHNQLGASLVDVYSAYELGVIALQCPKHEHYHIQSENVLLEVLREDGSMCRPGEPGRVVVTSLHNFAMPLIRYAIQDYAVMGDICSCGRGLPVLKRILGRSRNMLVMPDGTRRWAKISTGAVKVSDAAPVHQLQVIQHAIDDVEAKLVTARNLTGDEKQKVIHIIQDSLGYPFKVRLSFVENIQRTANGKFETFISNI